MAWMYILECRDGSYYVGHTDDIDKRMREHTDGTYGGHTARRRPVTLVFTDEFPTRQETLEREQQIKGWSRAKKEALIAQDWESLKRLSKRYHSQRTRTTARPT